MVSLASEIRSAPRRFLFGPVSDFLLLGGASLILLPLIACLPPDAAEPRVAAVALFLANFINHPHFASSYQIFYRNFRRKISGLEYPFSMRARYAAVGIAVPVAFLGFFAFGAASSDAVLLGRAANLMTFLVGWHYVKQGYGMLMVDAVLKRNFFSVTEKRILVANAYACWLAAWLHGNRYVHARDYFSLSYYTFDIPDPVFHVAAAVATITTALVLASFVTRCLPGEKGARGVPFNGVVAYLTSIYLWLVFVRVNPLFLLIVPAFHSLQYLAVVARYQRNLEAGRPDGFAAPAGRPFGRYFRSLAGYRMALFGCAALALGYMGFWGVPNVLDDLVHYDRAVFGASLFMFMSWIFINVHHYFIDNVIWKSSNPDVREHLFAAH